MSYCPFFHTLYDEKQPHGNLGRGTHYSVLRAPSWHDERFNRLNRCAFLDFAVVWDEDHDERVLEPLEALYREGLLAPVRYIGERKGMLSVVLAPEAAVAWGADEFTRYSNKVQAISDSLEDPWGSEVRSSDDSNQCIIHDSAPRIRTYLDNIHMLWQLGVKPAS
jgi:hypothetical protein